MKLKILLSILILILGLRNYAQNTTIKKAEKQYEQLAYIDAIKIYERVAEKGHKSIDLFEKLGNAYYFNSELSKANKWYTELFALNQVVEPEYYYRYSQTLKSTGDYEKANQMLEAFNEKSGSDLRAQLYESSKDYLTVIKENSGRYIIDNAGINSVLSDYGTSFLGDKLIFTSNREKRGITKRIQKWNNQAFTTLYTVKAKENGDFEDPEPFSNDIDSKFNEATPVFTKDGKTMYFTRNNYNDGKKGKDTDDRILLKLYKATLENNKWGNVTELSFNNDAYSTAHPALSPDEKTLYFASNMPGTLGESDIYKVSIDSKGNFGIPENLGKDINTEGKETFPFVSEANELYFSSNGHPGLGGLDVFVTKIANGGFGKISNVGEPVNGPTDDFAFIIDLKSSNGYFSSNRDGGLGYDDIYKFKEIRKLRCEQAIAGTIIDKETGLFLVNTKIVLLDEHMNILKEFYTDDQGGFSYDGVECGKGYYIRVSQLNYQSKEEKIILATQTGITKVVIALENNIKALTPGTDLAKVFRIELIYFDLDKSDIRPDAALDISKVIAVMKEYPKMKIVVASHTDSRGSKVYNLTLSQKRAQATLDYMVKSGIDKSRLTAKGYGESQPVNKCTDGVECTEAEHQENRRSQFLITEM